MIWVVTLYYQRFAPLEQKDESDTLGLYLIIRLPAINLIKRAFEKDEEKPYLNGTN